MMRFGPAGTPDSFAKMGYKSTLQMPKYLEQMGLNAFEYQCGRGVRVSADMAAKLGEAAKAKGVTLSLHAPYYISLSSEEEEKRLKSVDYILQSARAASAMGARRIVVHSGSCGKMTRESALELAMDTMKLAVRALDEEGLSHIHICPETMGKVNQLGTLEEVLALCSLDERLIPCVDFGHLYARTFGGLVGDEAFASIFAAIEKALGRERMQGMHVHFSKIAYTEKGGEKMHLTFADTQFGPEFGPAAKLFAQHGCRATIICESAGTQAEDAVTMRDAYEAARKELEQ